MDQRKERLMKVLQDYLATPAGPEKLQARDEMLRAYDYLIPITISRYINVPYGVETEDLEQIGRLSLWSAIEHYNPHKRVNGKPVGFVTYAIACIRKGISRWIHDCSWSKAAAEHEKTINRANAKLVQELGRPASVQEIADELKVTEERLIEMARSTVRNRPLYLNQSAQDSNYQSGEMQMQLEDIIPYDDLDHHTRLLQKEQVRLLVEMASEMRGNLREAAMLLFQGYSVGEIGQILQVSSSRAGMIVSTVRARLYIRIRRSEHKELFSEWLVANEDNLRPGRIRRRRRHPRIALMIGMIANEC